MLWLGAVGNTHSPGGLVGGMVLALAEQGAAPGTAGLAALAAGLGGSGADALAGGLGGTLPSVIQASQTNNFLSGGPAGAGGSVQPLGADAGGPPAPDGTAAAPYTLQTFAQPQSILGETGNLNCNIDRCYTGKGPIGSTSSIGAPPSGGIREETLPSALAAEHNHDAASIETHAARSSQPSDSSPDSGQISDMAKFLKSVPNSPLGSLSPAELAAAVMKAQLGQHLEGKLSPALLKAQQAQQETSLQSQQQEKAKHESEQSAPDKNPSLQFEGGELVEVGKQSDGASSMGHSQDGGAMFPSSTSPGNNELAQAIQANLEKNAASSFDAKDCDAAGEESAKCTSRCSNKRALVGRFVDLKSSEKGSSIKVNGEDWSKDENGVNIVVVDFNSGEVEASENFDTEVDGGASRAMTNFIDSLSPGKVMLVSMRGNAGEHMSDDAYKSLESVGARRLGLTRLKNGYRYVMLGLKGDTAPWEKEAITLDADTAHLSSPLVLGAAASRSPCVCLDWCKKNENHKNRGDVTAPSERGYSDIGGDMPVAQGAPGSKRGATKPVAKNTINQYIHGSKTAKGGLVVVPMSGSKRVLEKGETENDKDYDDEDDIDDNEDESDIDDNE